jgi:hypothetical protein
MAQVTQKQIMNPVTGLIWYEITFEALNNRILTPEEYHEINNMILAQIDYFNRNGEPKSINDLAPDIS